MIVNELVDSIDENGDANIDPAELVGKKGVVYDSQLHDYLLAWAKRRQIRR